MNVRNGKYAPKNLEKALDEFFGIYKGALTNLDSRTRASLAKNIGVIATGAKHNPCYTVFDKGEGQTPFRMPDTFLSLNKSNKLRIPFVQGKFNKGSTGTLLFCGNNNLQLIVSKRDTEIAKLEEGDPTADLWGFTIVRRAEPEEGAKNSSFKYLVPNGTVLSFKSDFLSVLPGSFPAAYSEPFESGSLVKLYEYKLKKSLRTIINFDLYYRLSLMLPNIALPITLYERRPTYKANSYEIILNGLSVRLEEDKRDNLEPGFPSSAKLTVMSEDMDLLKYVFRKEQISHYAPQEGVIFVINGQSHGFLPRLIFSRKSISLDYLQDSLLLLVDCTNLSTRTKEDLFMVSRDRLRDVEIKGEIEHTLEDILRTDPVLKALNHQRYQEEQGARIKDAQPVVSILSKVINQHPSLMKLLIEGKRIATTNELTPTGQKEEFKGKKFPTYFKLDKEYSLDNPKVCPRNKNFRLFFETDAENDYFDKNRGEDVGTFILKMGGKKVTQYSLNLWNGIATLTVQLPDFAEVNNIFMYEAIAEDRTQADPWINKFFVRVAPPIIIKPSNIEGKRTKPPGGDGDAREIPKQFDPPRLIPCRKTEENYRFRDDVHGALRVMNNPNGGYDFYINLDNPYLINEINVRKSRPAAILEDQFANGLAIISLALLNEYENNENRYQSDTVSVSDKIYHVTKAIAPFLIPMVLSLNNIELEKETSPKTQS